MPGMVRLEIILNLFFMKKLYGFLMILISVLPTYSCSSIPTYMYIEPIQEKFGNADDKKIENQDELMTFLKNIVNSGECFSIEAFGRKTFSPFIIHTKLLTHSFYLIKLINERYYTLSFSGSNFSFYSEGFWVLNKEVDLSSYRLFIEGNNIWNVRKLFTENLVDEQKTLQNIINAINNGTNYYFLDHYRNIPDYFNCNSAISDTIIFIQ